LLVEETAVTTLSQALVVPVEALVRQPAVQQERLVLQHKETLAEMPAEVQVAMVQAAAAALVLSVEMLPVQREALAVRERPTASLAHPLLAQAEVVVAVAIAAAREVLEPTAAGRGPTAAQVPVARPVQQIQAAAVVGPQALAALAVPA
jgi:hypothetical protein